jgi:pimeloyl-ACP methyl ester carboxylesterase
MPTVTANGISIYFERAGQGSRMLFLNGSGSTIETSRVLIDLFIPRFDVLVHDQRGMGRTEIPPDPYTMHDYAADAIALLDEVGWESCRVVGVSFGGMVAQELAVSAPDRVERLALACTSPGGPGGASYPLHELGDLDADQLADTYLPLLDTRFTQEWLAAHPRDQALVDMLKGRRARERSSEQRRGERAQLEARRHHDVCDRLGLVTCPTLVASGRYDGIAPPSNGAAIAERIRGAELRLYEGGHAFFAQDPQALPDIFDFLDS